MGTIIVMSTQFAFANYAFYRKVSNTCKYYRVTVDEKRMALTKKSDGSYSFSLEMESSRNNFEMVMLVGFDSAGQAVSHQINLGLSNAYTPNEITIRVNVPASKGETMVFEATCSSDIAMELAAGTLDSSDFMQKIDLQTS